MGGEGKTAAACPDLHSPFSTPEGLGLGLGQRSLVGAEGRLWTEVEAASNCGACLQRQRRGQRSLRRVSRSSAASLVGWMRVREGTVAAPPLLLLLLLAPAAEGRRCVSSPHSPIRAQQGRTPCPLQPPSHPGTPCWAKGREAARSGARWQVC
jgi:hypothetical protein